MARIANFLGNSMQIVDNSKTYHGISNQFIEQIQDISWVFLGIVVELARKLQDLSNKNRGAFP